VTKPNRDLYQAGQTLQDITAPNLTAALEHLARELHACDGWAEKGEQLGVHSEAELTPTERAADLRYELRNAVEDLRDAKARFLLELRNINDAINQAMRMRAPRPTQPSKPTGMCDQTGKEGAVVWGDPLCPATAVKGGMCQAHYTRWRRHRIAMGIDTSKDYEPA
jgi:hypothetical protein